MCCNEKKEEKWKEIPVSEARVGDEVFHCLCDKWFQVSEIDNSGLPIEIETGEWFIRDGKLNTNHKHPTLTKARRKVRTVVKEM